MGVFLFGIVVGSGLPWAFMSFRRNGHWREFNVRRRGSNPSPPGRKPAPPAGPPEQPLAAQLIRMDEGRTQRGFGNNGPTTPKPHGRH